MERASRPLCYNGFEALIVSCIVSNMLAFNTYGQFLLLPIHWCRVCRAVSPAVEGVLEPVLLYNRQVGGVVYRIFRLSTVGISLQSQRSWLSSGSWNSGSSSQEQCEGVYVAKASWQSEQPKQGIMVGFAEVNQGWIPATISWSGEGYRLETICPFLIDPTLIGRK